MASLTEQLGSEVRGAADRLPVDELTAAARRLRVAADRLVAVRAGSVRPLGEQWLAHAAEHLEHAARALLVAQEELAGYLSDLGLPGAAGGVRAVSRSPYRTPEARDRPEEPPARAQDPLLRWWSARVDAITGCSGEVDPAGAAADSAQLLRRV